MNDQVQQVRIQGLASFMGPVVNGVLFGRVKRGKDTFYVSEPVDSKKAEAFLGIPGEYQVFKGAPGKDIDDALVEAYRVSTNAPAASPEEARILDLERQLAELKAQGADDVAVAFKAMQERVVALQAENADLTRQLAAARATPSGKG